MMQYYTTDNNEFKQRYDVQFLYTFHSKFKTSFKLIKTAFTPEKKIEQFNIWIAFLRHHVHEL